MGIKLSSDCPRNTAHPKDGHLNWRPIRTVRLDRGLLQPDAPELLSVEPDSIVLWEINKVQPWVRHTPALIQFLGYNPLGHQPTTLAGRLLRYRIERGWTHQRLAMELDIDHGTLAKVEKSRSKRMSGAERKRSPGFGPGAPSQYLRLAEALISYPSGPRPHQELTHASAALYQFMAGPVHKPDVNRVPAQQPGTGLTNPWS